MAERGRRGPVKRVPTNSISVKVGAKIKVPGGDWATITEMKKDGKTTLVELDDGTTLRLIKGGAE